MEITVSIAGEGLNSRLAAKQLHLIADMVKAGVTEMDAFNIEFMGAFSVGVDFESNGPEPHTDFWDGEHNHIHAADGIVVFRQGPDTAEGTPDVEQLRDKGILLADWAREHGGITPFMPEDPGAGHNHDH
jgi:hypothetical protein